MDPKEIVREIKKIDPSCMPPTPGAPARNPNKTITSIVRNYAKSVGDDDRAKNFSSNGEYPEIHKINAVHAIADMAEFEGYSYIEVYHS